MAGKCESTFEHWGKLSYPTVWKCRLQAGHEGLHRDGMHEWIG